MVWAVAKASRAFAVMWSLRHTLKTLKKVSRTESETLSDCRQRTAACSDALLFWVVFGFVVVWEQYFEVFTRWFPGYYYLKSAVLVLISFPKLRISHLAFGHVVVPLLELFYAHCGGGSIPSALTLLRLLPLVTIAIMFPNIVYHDLGGSPVLSESSLCDDGPPAERRGETDAIESVAVADPRDEEEATEAETAPETEEPEEAVLWEADYSWDTPPPAALDGGDGAASLKELLDESEDPAQMKGTVAGGSPSPDARARVPAPRAVVGTPPVTPLADNRVMLSKTARRLSYFSERYAAMGGMRNNLAEDASSPAAAAPRRSSALSPILPTLNRRAIAGGGPHGTDDHGPTLSPLHAGTVVRDETAAVDPVSRVAERVRRSAVPPMTPPPTRYVAAAFSKENRNNVPNEGGMLSSVRSMWTGDSKMSIRESLKSALDVHTPPPNSVARIRRSSAMLPSQGAAASIVAAAQMRPPQTAGVGRRKTMLSGMSSTNTRRVSTAPTSSGEGQHRDKLNSSYVRNNNMGGGGSIGVGGSGRAGRDSTTLPALRNRLGRNSSKGGGGY